MALIRFTEQPRFMNPWAEFERIRQGLDVLSRNMLSDGRVTMPATVFPPLNIYETKDELILKAELPGVKVEDLDISLEGDTLTIQGQRKPTEENEKTSYHRREIEAGSFSRALTLPIKVDPDKISAKLADGILTITLQKADEIKPRHIKISTE